MNRKMQWLRNQMLSLNLQGMIVTNPVNIRYLTNIQAEGTLLVTRKENIFITDGRYVEAVNSVLTIDDEIIVVDDGSKDKTLEKLIENFDLVEVPYNYIEYIKTKPYKRLFKSTNEKYKNLVLPLKDMKSIEWKWIIFPIATFYMKNGESYRILIFNKKYLTYYCIFGRIMYMF